MASNVASLDAALSPAQPARSSKPRLLWRGALLLGDGTRLPGVAFVSHLHPFISSDYEKGPEGTPGAAEAEAEADMCLALEMVRHRPLRVKEVLMDDGSGTQIAESSWGTNEKRPWNAGKGKGKEREVSERTVTWEASGLARMYIDPREHATLAFFERHFCSDTELASTLPPRTRRILTISLDTPYARNAFQSSSAANQYSANASQPSWSSQNAGAGLAATQEIAIFGQLADKDITSSELGSEDGGATEDMPAKTLRMVLGRKVVQKPKVGSARTMPRPDDPLPRSSLATLRNLSSRDSSSQSPGLGSPLISPGVVPDAASSSAVTSTTFKYPDFPRRAHLDASRNAAHQQAADTSARRKFRKAISTPDVFSAQSPHLHPDAQAAWGTKRKMPSSSAAHDASDEASLTLDAAVEPQRAGEGDSVAPRVSTKGGSHTPGQRGEKRPRLLDRASDRPSVRGDRIRSVIESGASIAVTDAIDVDAVAGEERESVKVEKGDPMLEDTARQSLMEGKLPIKKEKSATPAPSGVEARNRAAIKKLVHHQLLGHGLERTDADYVTLYNPVCAGTCLALRHVLPYNLVDRAHAAQIVATHLGMYLSVLGRGTSTGAGASPGVAPSGDRASTPSGVPSGTHAGIKSETTGVKAENEITEESG